MSITADKPRLALPITCLFVVAGLILQALFKGTLGQIGIDSDDLMRLMQVRDFMQGQSWFDTNQYRLGLEGGTAMHWSRIPDIPLIILTGLFDLFLPYATAEKIALSVWPPLCGVGVIYGIWIALKHTPGRYTKIFGLILMAFIFVRFFRFSPGAIDHHNLQMLLLALALGFSMDPRQKTISAVIAGIACALSIAIGMEVYVFVGIFCLYFALNWAVNGSDVRRSTQGFGVALALGLLAIFFGTIAPSQYGIVACDAFSLISLSAGALGGLGLAVLAMTLSAKSIAARLGGLGLLGAICLALFLIQAPQCLSNPLSDLPPIVQTLWLDEIVEAQNIFDLWAETPAEAAFTLGIQFAALLVTLWLLRRGEDRRLFGLMLALLAASVLLSLYQVRFYAFGFLFAIVPLARWIGLMYEKKKQPGSEGSVAYILALAVSLPYVWSFPFLMMGEEAFDGTASVPAAQCYSDAVFTAMADLPKGVMLANSNAGPDIIDRTSHRAVNGNYHRNVEGIKSSIETFTASPDEAQALLQKLGVDYLHFCGESGETQVLVDHAPDGLFARLSRGEVPNYLTPTGPVLENGAVTLYKVN